MTDFSCPSPLSRDPDPRIDQTVQQIGKKIAEARTQKLPYLLIIGDKEAEAGAVAVRSRAGDEGAVPFAEFKARILEEIRLKK